MLGDSDGFRAGLSASGYARRFATVAACMAMQTLVCFAQGTDADIKRLHSETASLFAEGEYQQAERAATAALALAESMLDANDPATVKSVYYLGQILTELGRFEQGEALLRRALAAQEKSASSYGVYLGDTLDGLGAVVRNLGRLAEAEKLHRRALAVYEQFGNQAAVARSSMNLAHVLTDLGRFEDAEWLYVRALTIREEVLPENDPSIARSLSSLAHLVGVLGRVDEAERLHRRALAIYEDALPVNHPDIALGANNLAVLLQARERLEEAERLHRRALEIYGRNLPENHPQISLSINNLADVLRRQGRLKEAEQLDRRALAIRQATLPEDHPDIAQSFNNLAATLSSLEQLEESEQLRRRALAIWKKALPSNHPLIAESLENLAYVKGSQGAWNEAVDLWNIATKIRTAPENRGALSDYDWRDQAIRRISAALILRNAGEKPEDFVIAARADAFVDLQWEQLGGTGKALAAAMARASAAPEVAPLARERDRALAEIKQLDVALFTALADSASDTRTKRLSVLRADRDEATSRLAALDEKLRQQFPAYSELAEGLPTPIGEMLPLLKEGEVLISLTPYKDKGLLYAISRDGAISAHLPEAAESSYLGQRLRCSAAGGLDPACLESSGLSRSVSAQSAATKETSRGAVAVKTSSPPSGDFDLELAHDLYKRLFPQHVRDYLQGKKLIIVPAPELMGLPFQLLVTEPPPAGWRNSGPSRTKAYREAKWLFQNHASITLLPTLSSLRALRSTAPRRSSADRIFLGIGDPAIGRNAGERDAAPLDCGLQQPGVLASANFGAVVPRSVVGTPNMLFPEGRDPAEFALADPELVRSQPRLADTRCELISVAAAVGEVRVGKDLLFGAEATETKIRDLDESGELARYRIIHLATHGLLSGDLGSGEPGLVLTPPETASARDDGILTASEIATLTLGSDWVVLSACNTAAGNQAEAQALSGLARSFFYAGAKSLLVSSWPVYSTAAVSITTNAFGAMKHDPGISRAEALTSAMRTLLSSADSEFTAHPSYWAPFFLVGEGGN